MWALKDKLWKKSISIQIKQKGIQLTATGMLEEN
jgi:hypothetical protein